MDETTDIVYAEKSKPVTKGQMLCNSIYVLSLNRLKETESRILVARGWGGAAVSEDSAFSVCSLQFLLGEKRSGE
jgi:hypothetical protein